MDYKIIIYIIFGILPSLVWLSFYLRKDAHPEPKKMIMTVFFWGALITLPVFFIQIGLKELLDIATLKLGLSGLDNILLLSLPYLNSLSLIAVLIYWFFIISFSEEIFKYLVIKLKVMNSPNLDEPLDIMLYMVVAALGFAALENILYLFAPISQILSFNELVNRTMIVALIRFIGATFLHTLCSAIIGYALAISFCEVKRKYLSVASGMFMAVLLHGLYDFSIMTLEGFMRFAIPVIIIITLAFLVFSGFERLKKMRSICKIE